MKNWNWRTVLVSVLIALACFCMIGGCDSGEKVVDEVAGNRALKQYHKSKNDIENISRRQAEKYGTIPGDDEKGDDRK
jgi:hypothetical protein